MGVFMNKFFIFAAAAALTLPATAGAVTIGTAGGGNCYPFGCNDAGAAGDRYQQLYNASAFSGPLSIGSISFKLNGGSGLLKAGVFELSLSTYSGAMGSLSATDFDGNLGADNALVFSGALLPQFSGGFLTFDTSSFNYNPLAGNLLLDVKVIGGASLDYETFFDSDFSGSGLFQRVSNYEVPPSNNNWGLVTSFDASAAVPEPAAWAMMIVGFGLVGGAMRKRTKVSVSYA
jgi:hypothetical protein